MIEKDFNIIRLRSNKLFIAILILLILGISFLIRLTPLINLFWINYITAIILKNGISLIIISGLLIALHIVELKKFKKMLEKEDESNVVD